MTKLQLGLFVGMIAAAPLRAQSIPVRTLAQPEARFEHGYTRIASIRELSAGRVVILDDDETIVQLLNANWTAAASIGRKGSGPGEFNAPNKLFALAGDTSGILDGAKMHIVAPDGKIVDVIDFRAVDPGAPRPLIRSSQPTETDARGRLYARAQPWAIGANGSVVPSDSSAIERWARAQPLGKRDTAAFVVIDPAVRPTMLVAGMSARPATPLPAFRTEQQWAVARDGRIALVSPDPYRVAFIDANGRRRPAVAITYEQITVTEAHKSEWFEARRRAAQRSGGFYAYSIPRGGGPPVAVTPPPVPVAPPSEWPRFLPPFLTNAVRFAADGRLWVQRTTTAGGPQTFDVIDEAGRVVEKVVLPKGSRLVGFGAGSVFIARIDAVDLEYLERHRLAR